MAVEAVHEETKPLEFQVSWVKTKMQVSGGLLEETVHFLQACDKSNEILQSFIFRILQ